MSRAKGNLMLSIFIIVLLTISQQGIYEVVAAGAVKGPSIDVDGDGVYVIRLKSARLAGVEAAEVISTLKEHARRTQAPIIEYLEKRGVEVLNTFWLANAILVKVEDKQILEEIGKLPQVRRIHPNFRVSVPKPKITSIKPKEGAVTWGLQRICAPDAWDMGYTGAGIRIAVLDTGVDITHPDLSDKMWTDDPTDPTYPGGWIEFDEYGNIVTGSTPHDTDGHGTHVSGTCVGGDASGTAIGVAPDAWLMHALILPGGGGTFAQVIAGMQWAIEPFDQYGNPAGEPADVVSMSFGAEGYWEELLEPINNMRAADIVPVAAIGNEGAGTSSSPGNVYECFGIGAIDEYDEVPYWSSGEIVDWPEAYPEPYVKPDFSAPGVNVYSALPGGDWGYMDGTSMATPHVSGAVALIRQAHPDWSVDQIYEALMMTAHDLGDPGMDTRYGWGVINVAAAIGYAPGAPDIRVEPESIAVELPPDTIYNTSLYIYNDGEGTLTYDIADEEEVVPPVAMSRGSSSSIAPPEKREGRKVKTRIEGGDVLLLKDIDPWGHPANEIVLDDLGIPYDVATSSDIPYLDLSHYKLIIIASDQPDGFYDVIADNMDMFESYVSAGGILEVHAADNGWAGGEWEELLPGGVHHETTYDEYNSIVAPDHPIVSGLDDSDFEGWYHVSHGYFTDLLPGTLVIMEDSTGNPTAIEYRYGDGLVIATMQTWEWALKHGYCRGGRVLYNAISYAYGGVAAPPTGWLDEEPKGGDVPPGDYDEINVIFNTTGLEPGDHWAYIHISSNDPDEPIVDVMVHLIVTTEIPDVWFEPHSFEVTARPGEVKTETLVIGNIGEADLEFSLMDVVTGPAFMAKKVATTTSPPPVDQRMMDGGVAEAAEGERFAGELLEIGISEYGELDWADARPEGEGYGFHYIPADPYADYADIPAESVAVWWDGEGYVVYYDGNLAYSYPDEGHVGIIPISRSVLLNTTDEAVYQVVVETEDHMLRITFTFYLNKHDKYVVLRTEFENIGDRTLGDVRYKRVVDWDCNNGPGDDEGFDWIPEHFLLKADDVSMGKSFSYGISVLFPRDMVYDWDLYAWDDLTDIEHGYYYIPDGPVDGDYCVAVYLNVGPLRPGERKPIAFAYAVGEGADPDESLADLIDTILRAGMRDAPWLDEEPKSGTIPPGEEENITITFDARTLEPGDYFASIILRSNDPDEPFIDIPVIFHVKPGKILIEDPAECRDPDILFIYAQLTRDAIVLYTDLKKPINDTIMAITGMDTDMNPGTGCRHEYFNDIGADYMAFAVLGPVPITESKALKACEELFPGLKVEGYDVNMLYLYKWEKDSKTWDLIWEGWAWLTHDRRTFSFWIPLILMNSDGDMWLVQDVGTLMKITDRAPDEGHGKTAPLIDVAVIDGWITPHPTYLDMNTTVGAIVENQGERIEVFNVEFYALRTGPIPMGAKPKPTLIGVVENVTLNPGLSTGVSISWIPDATGIYDIEVVIPPLHKERDIKDNSLIMNTTVLPSHDMAIVNMTVIPETPYAGQEVLVNVTLENQGVVTEIDLPVELYVNGDLYFTRHITIAPGERANVTFYWYPDMVGTATLEARVEPLPEEADVADNSMEVEVEVSRGHDIAVTDLWAEPESPDAGEETTIYATVENIGEFDEEDIPVFFYVDGELIATVSIPELAAGESTTVNASWTPTTPGTYEVNVTAGPVPEEIFREDNSMAMDIRVRGHDLAIIELSMKPTTPKAGRRVTISVKVLNRGTYRENSQVYVRITGSGGYNVTLRPRPVRRIGPGRTKVVKFRWRPTDPGSYNIIAWVEPVAGEFNTTNNYWEETVEVLVRGLRLKIKVTPKKIPASGSMSIITISLVDKKGNPIHLEGVEIKLKTTRGELSSYIVVTGPDGTAQVVLTPDGRRGKAIIKARIIGTKIKAKAVAKFI